MSTLFEKARSLLERLTFKRSEEKATELEKFVREEIKPHELKIDITVRDLVQIHSRACDVSIKASYAEEVNQVRIHSDPKIFQAYCYFQAIQGFLRSKGLLIHDLRMGDQKDEDKKKQV